MFLHNNIHTIHCCYSFVEFEFMWYIVRREEDSCKKLKCYSLYYISLITYSCYLLLCSLRVGFMDFILYPSVVWYEVLQTLCMSILLKKRMLYFLNTLVPLLLRICHHIKMASETMKELPHSTLSMLA